MNRIRIVLALIAFTFAATTTDAQTALGVCPMAFSVGITDTLGNADTLTDSDQKWLNKFLKHYQGICYIQPSPEVKVLLSISVSMQTEQLTPRVANIPVYTLQILDARGGGKPRIVRTFQRSKAGSTAGGVPGLIASMGNPERQVIEDAIDWIAHANTDLSTEPVPETNKPTGPKG